ncbi:MAG: PorV/PorQ family protein [Candidatus Krumholzibacteriota bacterium]|nr:PorV/PorQ family protein [Candidatus Krumholzibacteriota bacterium]
MHKLTVGFCLLLLVLPGAASAGKYAGEFMALGGGARAMGLGGAFVAVADDATASYWNPAGLAAFGAFAAEPADWQASLMHSERFGDLIDYNFASVAFPLVPGESAWGLTFVHMGIRDIPVIPWSPGMIGNSDGDQVYEPELGEFLNFDTGGIPTESVNDFALFVSYARRTAFGDAGASVKLIRNDQVTGVTSLGIGIDVGFIKRDLWRDLIVGMKLQDATGTYISWSTGTREFIYPALKLGLAYPLEIEGMNSRILLAVDGDFRYEDRRDAAQFWVGDASADFHVGAEIVIREMVALRGGYDMGRPTAGAGFLLDDFGPWKVSVGIDYALLVHDELDTTHRISLLMAH